MTAVLLHGDTFDHLPRRGSPKSSSAPRARRLADPRAAWRRAPTSSAQASSLQRLGVPVPADATKGEASDLIALADGIRRLDRLTTRAA